MYTYVPTVPYVRAGAARDRAPGSSLCNSLTLSQVSSLSTPFGKSGRYCAAEGGRFHRPGPLGYPINTLYGPSGASDACAYAGAAHALGARPPPPTHALHQKKKTQKRSTCTPRPHPRPHPRPRPGQRRRRRREGKGRVGGCTQGERGGESSRAKAF